MTTVPSQRALSDLPAKARRLAASHRLTLWRERLARVGCAASLILLLPQAPLLLFPWANSADGNVPHLVLVWWSETLESTTPAVCLVATAAAGAGLFSRSPSWRAAGLAALILCSVVTGLLLVTA